VARGTERPTLCLVLGAVPTAFILTWLGRVWVCRPVEKLIHMWGALSVDRRPGAMRMLPMTRQDEAGQLARALYRLASTALKGDYDARQLRRTLDHRVSEATRRATHQLRQMAMRDALTDLANRRFLDDHLEPLVQSVQASGDELVCVMIDVDGFKGVNDSLGHAAGDELLIFLGSLIRAIVRGEDYAVRCGGDEFLVLMPQCDLERAGRFGEQLRVLFRQHVSTALPPEVRSDLSMGVAALRQHKLADGEALLARADANLYAAKRAGRGRTVGV
jgi:two-component system cell cycle response regulator